MARVVSSYGLVDALAEVGYPLPDECSDVKLLMPVDGVMRLSFKVNVTDEKLLKLSQALALLATRHA